MKNVEHQGFLPTSYYDEFNSEEESSSEESESESEDESPYSQFLHFGKASQASMKRYSCILNLKDEFVVEDPFVEVKDEDIKSVETDFNDDGTRIIHLKNGLMLWGKFRRKRRYGLGSITGAPLEAKGNCVYFTNKHYNHKDHNTFRNMMIDFYLYLISFSIRNQINLGKIQGRCS